MSKCPTCELHETYIEYDTRKYIPVGDPNPRRPPMQKCFGCDRIVKNCECAEDLAY